MLGKERQMAKKKSTSKPAKAVPKAVPKAAPKKAVKKAPPADKTASPFKPLGGK